MADQSLLKWHVFDVASLEATSIFAYLKDKQTGDLAYLAGNTE